MQTLKKVKRNFSISFVSAEIECIFKFVHLQDFKKNLYTRYYWGFIETFFTQNSSKLQVKSPSEQ